LGDELGGLSTSLGLFASPPLILSAESVVVMEWRGMRYVDCNPGLVDLSRCKIQGAKPALLGPMSSD